MSMLNQGSARHAFDDELEHLEHDLLEMASYAAGMVADAADALSRLDTNLARDVMKRDDEVDRRDLAIEERCVRLLALQQPMARDLRVIGTAMKMITDIERIGDLAVDIARITLKIQSEYGEVGFIDLPRMAAGALSMVREAIEAFVHQDLDRVKAVCDRDEDVDDLYRQLRGQIFQNMRERPDMVVSDGWLLLAIHHVERIADHAVNIAERVQFMVTGEFKKLACDLP